MASTQGADSPNPATFVTCLTPGKRAIIRMDQKSLQRRLQRAHLILGDVRQTIQTFYQCYMPAPLGAVMFDLNLYSSTKSALEVLTAPVNQLLPRVHCYFDDIIGYPLETYNDRTGERLAINEFNRDSTTRYLDVSNMFRGYLPCSGTSRFTSVTCSSIRNTAQTSYHIR